MIGIFDSGVGGLSVWREVARCIPNAPLVYLADQAHVPYGSRSLEEVRRLTLRCVRWLVERGCSVVVIACNTASSAALDAVRETFPDTPVVGMEPAVKPAALHTKTGVVGVLATRTTFSSSRYADLIRKWSNGVRVIEQPCVGWVEAVEQLEKLALNPSKGWAVGRFETTCQLVFACVTPLLAQRADTLVLGCTHFPFLVPCIERVIDEWRASHADAPPVTIIDPTPAVAQQVARVWKSAINPKGLQDPSGLMRDFYTTGDAERLGLLLAHLIKQAAAPQAVVI